MKHCIDGNTDGSAHVAGLDVSGHHVRIAAYLDGVAAAEPDFMLGLLQDMSDCFAVTLTGCYGAADGNRQKAASDDPVEWFRRELVRIHRASSSGQSGYALLLKGSRKLQWECHHASTSAADEAIQFLNAPYISLAVGLELEKYQGATLEWCKRVAARLNGNKRVWHALFEPGPRYLAARYSTYCSFGWTGHVRWERAVAQSRWLDYVGKGHDRVHGVHWGMSFGPAFAERLLKAGLEKEIEWAREEFEPYGANPIVIRDEETGSMTVFLDDDPVRFAQLRERLMDPEVDKHDLQESIKCGALMWHVMSRAGLL